MNPATQNMHLVLLSGGSGKRLWPLSNDSRSKQFLKVLKNPENGMESMVQRVWRQITLAGFADQTTITTSKAQSELLENQLGNVQSLIIEPERRDTFPAIALSATYLYSKKRARPDDVVIVLPVDPYVESGFFERIKLLGNVLQESGSNLALLGVRPTYPSTKYGYIVPQEGTVNLNHFAKVSHFKEKPTISEAEVLIEQNAKWNCGVFAFRLNYLFKILTNKGLPVEYDFLYREYRRLPKISFDYEVVEKENSIVMVSYDGYWKDLGTWNTLTEEMDSLVIGNAFLDNTSENTHVINELDIPITVLGTSNAVIAASPDGILVCDKNHSPFIKDIVSTYDNLPMHMERRWGYYRILDYTQKESKEILTRRVTLHEGKNLSYQFHNHRTETWTIISGKGEVVIDGKARKVLPGDVVKIPNKCKHSIRAETTLEFIEIQYGTISEEDVHRLTYSWEDALIIK
ncbi:sugar phosphate nucleotidyltransferase [Paenibacillus sp.]|uniref:sugar phosphate nucleotidyltransferase n=1 Tax=Paenibacillus sp. TaxID=58172 RepID=UPI002D506B8D|nr:sugar phosphate nucleotidyltransferase [Paenibacillus sp.]HZG86181.1 sugar phosphate nucleotidyltransferase [Paenibacillus sp.]